MTPSEARREAAIGLLLMGMATLLAEHHPLLFWTFLLAGIAYPWMQFFDRAGSDGPR